MIKELNLNAERLSVSAYLTAETAAEAGQLVALGMNMDEKSRQVARVTADKHGVSLIINLHSVERPKNESHEVNVPSAVRRKARRER